MSSSQQPFRHVGVVGLGTMGAGIVETFARSGYRVVGVEVDEGSLQRGRQHLLRSTSRAVAKGRLTAAEQEALVDRVRFTTELVELGECDLVVEAVLEKLSIKQALFQQVDTLVGSDAILATNTSSLSVTELAAATSRPGRVLGVHFFNPAPVQALVEVVRTVVTESAVVDRAVGLVRSLGKTPVVCGDRAGFIANHLLFGYLNSAVTMLDQGFASREDIDAAMRVGCGYPMGPLALLDLIGLDTASQILESIHAQSRDRRHAPAPLLRQLVTAGLLGRKSGRGFYRYQSQGSPVVVAGPQPAPVDRGRAAEREVTSVGVVGSGATARLLARAATGAGYATTQLDATQLDAVGEADVVLEAAGGDPSATAELLGRLDERCRPTTILATTSHRPVVELAPATRRPHAVMGLHVRARVGGDGKGPPAALLLEAVPSLVTDPEVAETVRSLAARLVGEVGAVVTCGDRAGFLVDALLHPYLNDAVRLLETRYASVEDIDTAMTLGCALPSGPFEVLDAVGLDVVWQRLTELYDEQRDPALSPAPLLHQLVTAGRLGRSTGRGFREHPGSELSGDHGTR